MTGITITGGVTIEPGVFMGTSPVLMLGLDSSTYAANPTGTQQNVSGTSDNIGFFPYGWDNPAPSGFGNVTIGWTVVGHPDWVVTAVDSVSHVITITGGTFTSGDFYQFTNEYTWFDTVANRPFLLQNGASYDPGTGIGAMSFTPSAQQFAQSSTSLSDLSTWTVEVWHYYTGTNTGASPCIITEVYPGSTGNINYFMGALDSSTTNLEAGYFNGGFQITPGGYNLTADNWYQIVGTYDGKNVKLYVNNTLVGQTTASGSQPISSQGGINLMRRWDNAEYWGGKLGIVNVYQGAMRSSEVTDSWNTNKARFGL